MPDTESGMPTIPSADSNPSFASQHLENAMNQFGDLIPTTGSGRDMEYKSSTSSETNTKSMENIFGNNATKETFAGRSILEVIGAIKSEGDRYTSAGELLSGMASTEAGRQALTTLQEFMTPDTARSRSIKEYSVKQTEQMAEPKVDTPFTVPPKPSPLDA